MGELSHLELSHEHTFLNIYEAITPVYEAHQRLVQLRIVLLKLSAEVNKWSVFSVRADSQCYTEGSFALQKGSQIKIN